MILKHLYKSTTQLTNSSFNCASKQKVGMKNTFFLDIPPFSM
jgi:hypothetical protein